MMSTSDSPRWNLDRIMNLVVGVAIAAAIVFMINYLRGVLIPFFVACFIAYILHPVVEFNRRWTHEKGRMAAVALTLLEVLVVIGLMLYLFLPKAIAEFDSLETVMHEIETGNRTVPAEFAGVIEFIRTYVNPTEIKATLMSLHVNTLISKGTTLLGASFEVLKEAVDVILAVIYLIFILLDYPRIARGFKLIIPYKFRGRADEVFADVRSSMNSYFRGQGLVALCAMVLYSIGFLIAGFPLAIPMGVVVGVLYMIPYFQYITVIPVALICLVYSVTGTVGFFEIFGKSILVYFIVQPCCDYIITPRVMGKTMGMNAAVILLSLSVWGSLLGIIGMIIALPMTSLILTYYQRYISFPPGTPEHDGTT